MGPLPTVKGAGGLWGLPPCWSGCPGSLGTPSSPPSCCSSSCCPSSCCPSCSCCRRATPLIHPPPHHPHTHHHHQALEQAWSCPGTHPPQPMFPMPCRGAGPCCTHQDPGRSQASWLERGGVCSWLPAAAPLPPGGPDCPKPARWHACGRGAGLAAWGASPKPVRPSPFPEKHGYGVLGVIGTFREGTCTRGGLPRHTTGATALVFSLFGVQEERPVGLSSTDRCPHAAF